MKSVTNKWIMENLSSSLIIDVREKEEYANIRINGTMNIPFQELISNPQKYLKKDQKYYILCGSGKRASKIVVQLKKLGYKGILIEKGINGFPNDYVIKEHKDSKTSCKI